MENMSVERKKPLAPVTAVWDEGSLSQYPDIIRVPMEGGKVVDYRIDTRQPHPAFLFALNLIKEMPKGSYQYGKTAGCDGNQR